MRTGLNLNIHLSGAQCLGIGLQMRTKKPQKNFIHSESEEPPLHRGFISGCFRW